MHSCPMAAAVLAAGVAGLICAAGAGVARGTGQGLLLDVSVDGGKLSYNVSINGEVWFAGSPFTVYLEGKEQTPVMKASGATRGAGRDAMGAFTSTAVAWDVAGTAVTTTFREYTSCTSIVFSVAYPQGAQRTARSGGDSQPSARFPSFQTEGGALPKLGYRSWAGNMCSDYASTGPMNFSTLASDPNWLNVANSVSNGPMALYDRHDGDCVLLSPHSEFMTEQHRITPGPQGSMSFGPGGELASIPAGFRVETILVQGRGVTATTLAWGKHARAVHSPPRAKLPDVTLSRLGYWTDNGAFYYYYARPPTKPLEPEETLRSIVATYRALKIPVKYIQLDAWWYRTHACEQSYACACIEDFAPDTSAFNWTGAAPSGPGPYFKTGLAHLAVELDVQWDLYQNYFCPQRANTSNVWSARGYTFVVDSYGAEHPGTGFAHVVPQQARKFFSEVWSQGKAQGMASTEWDYQSTAYDMMPHYRSDAAAASDYAAGMADAALELGVAIQYCMSYPRFILESMKHAAVTNARGSEDYAGGYGNLMGVGYTSLLYEAVGLAVSKDTFSTYDRTEVIVALLSKGPVGPSDALSWMPNRSDWVKATCNSEGLLLQPSTPIRTIDAKFSLDPAGHTVPDGSEVWASSATVTGGAINYTTHIVLALTLPKAGFALWRNDTVPMMYPDVEYVYRVQPAGTSSMGAGDPRCANGSAASLSSGRRPLAPAANAAALPTATGTTCVVQRGRDILSGEAAASTPAHPATIVNSTHDECCAACASSPSCTAWVFGPLNGEQTCFLAMNVRGTKPVASRDFCCIGNSSSSPRPSIRGAGSVSGASVNVVEHVATTCVLPVPAGGVPLSVESSGDANCSAAPPNDPTNGHDELVTIYPVVSGFVLLGELDKWVTLSPNRFSNLVITTDTLTVDLRGGVDELCVVTLVVDGIVVVHEVRIGAMNTATLVVTK